MPISPYGYHKLMSERICEEFHRFFGLKPVHCVFFQPMVKGLKKQLFWDLFQKAKNNSEINLFGTGNESRDYIYIGDLLQAVLLVALNAKCEGQAINVANGEEISIKECVKVFYNLFEPKINYRFSGQVRQGDPNNWAADISILKDLGYKQKYSLQDGLMNYYKWLTA